MDGDTSGDDAERVAVCMVDRQPDHATVAVGGAHPTFAALHHVVRLAAHLLAAQGHLHKAEDLARQRAIVHADKSTP